MCVLGAANGFAQGTMGVIAQNEAAKMNEDMIDAQSIQRQHEITEQGSLQLNETMMQARAERAHSIAVASGAHVNLGSGSFLASLQTTQMASSNKKQVELENEQNAQIDNTLKTQSELNAKASKPTFLGALTQIGLSTMAGAAGESSSYNPNGANGTPVNVSSSATPGSIDANADGVYSGSGLDSGGMASGIGAMQGVDEAAANA